MADNLESFVRLNSVCHFDDDDVAKTLLCGQQGQSYYVAMFSEALLAKYALTLSCMETCTQGDEAPQGSGASGSIQAAAAGQSLSLSTRMKAYLHSFVLLCKMAVSQIRAQNDLPEDEEEESGDEGDEPDAVVVDSPPELARDRAFRAVVDGMEGASSSTRMSVSEGVDDLSMPMGRDELMRLLLEGEEEGEDAGGVMPGVQHNGFARVYILRKTIEEVPYIFLVLCCPDVTSKVLHTRFVNTYTHIMTQGRRRRGRGRGRGRGGRGGGGPPRMSPVELKKIVNNMRLVDHEKALDGWMRYHDIPARVCEGCKYPTEIFSPKTILSVLLTKGAQLGVCTEMFMDPRDNPQKMMMDAREGSLTYLNLTGDSLYSLPAEDFTVDAIERGLLPWLPVCVTTFFADHFGKDAGAGLSPEFVDAISQRLLPRKKVTYTMDPLTVLGAFVYEHRERNMARTRNASLTMAQKVQMLEVLGYVVESPKTHRYFSSYIQSISDYIRARRAKRSLDRAFEVLGAVVLPEGEEEGEDVPEEERVPMTELSGASGLSKFLWLSANDEVTLRTIPPQYASLVVVTSLIVPNCQDRRNGMHFHMIMEGEPEVGKSYMLGEIMKNLAPGVSRKLGGLSRKAFTTMDPQNGGVAVIDEPPTIFTETLAKMSSSQKDQAGEMRTILTEGEFFYDCFTFVEDKYGKRRRQTDRTGTSLLMNFLLSANEVKNKDEAMGSRFVHVHVWDTEEFNLIKSAIRGECLARQVREAPKLRQRFRDLTTLMMIMNMAVSAGILEPPTVGIMTGVLHDVLKLMRAKGLMGCRKVRNFRRILMVMDQLIYARVLIEKYLAVSVTKTFDYKDLADMEKDLYATVETLIIAANFLSQQYICPVRMATVDTTLRYYFECNMGDFVLDAEDLEAATRIVNRGVPVPRASDVELRDLQPPRKRARTESYVSVRVSPPAVGTPGPGVGAGAGAAPAPPRRRKKKKKRKKKRRREMDEAEAFFARPEEAVASAESRKRSRPLPPRVVSSEVDRQHSFLIECTLRQLDRIYLVMTKQKSTFGDRPSMGFMMSPDGKKVSLNYLMIATPTPWTIVRRDVYDAMVQKPMRSEVETQFENLRKKSHVPAVVLPTIQTNVHEKIWSHYKRGIVSGEVLMPREERVAHLRTLLMDRVKVSETLRRKPKVKLMHAFLEKADAPGGRNVTKIIMHTSLLNSVDPRIITKTILERTQMSRSRTSYIYTPVPAVDITECGKRKDMEFVKFSPDPSQEKLTFYNPSYLSSFMRRYIQRSDRGVAVAEEDAFDLSMSAEETMQIDEPVDEYMKRQRHSLIAPQ